MPWCPAHQLATAMKEIRELRRLPGYKTQEVEILKKAVGYGRSKTGLRLLFLPWGRQPVGWRFEQTRGGSAALVRQTLIQTEATVGACSVMPKRTAASRMRALKASSGSRVSASAASGSAQACTKRSKPAGAQITR